MIWITAILDAHVHGRVNRKVESSEHPEKVSLIAATYFFAAPGWWERQW